MFRLTRSRSLYAAVPPAANFTPRVASRQLSSMKYENILTETPRPRVGLITLNRPQALNALSTPLFRELNHALSAFDGNDEIGAMIITGSDKAFAAGADIKEMLPKTFSEAYKENFIAPWSHLATAIRKPVIAAVSGYALGGGCELALMCDFIYCSSNAKFGQPEITLGVIPGAGGSQRLTAAIGKARAMELILTGRMFTAKEAGDWGMAARVIEGGKAEVLQAAIDTAGTIAGHSQIATMAAKEVVNKSQELALSEGVSFERRLFQGLFGSKDQKNGMQAFVDKKKPTWDNM